MECLLVSPDRILRAFHPLHDHAPIVCGKDHVGAQFEGAFESLAGLFRVVLAKQEQTKIVMGLRAVRRDRERALKMLDRNVPLPQRQQRRPLPLERQRLIGDALEDLIRRVLRGGKATLLQLRHRQVHEGIDRGRIERGQDVFEFVGGFRKRVAGQPQQRGSVNHLISVVPLLRPRQRQYKFLQLRSRRLDRGQLRSVQRRFADQMIRHDDMHGVLRAPFRHVARGTILCIEAWRMPADGSFQRTVIRLVALRARGGVVLRAIRLRDRVVRVVTRQAAHRLWAFQKTAALT